jgi:hypothetical protein
MSHTTYELGGCFSIMFLKVENTEKAVNGPGNTGTYTPNPDVSRKIFSVLILKWQTLKSLCLKMNQ